MNVVYTAGDGRVYTAADGSVLAFAVTVLVTDRTAEDVLRWKTLHDKGWEAMTPEEQAEWVGGMKGSYNYTDMNRVEGFVESLETRFLKKGINLALSTKTDWARTSWPTKSDMNRYFRNIAAIRSAVGVELDFPAAPTTGTLLDYKKANDIEKILQVVDNWLSRVEANQMYAGDLYLGEV